MKPALMKQATKRVVVTSAALLLMSGFAFAQATDSAGRTAAGTGGTVKTGMKDNAKGKRPLGAPATAMGAKGPVGKRGPAGTPGGMNGGGGGGAGGGGGGGA